MMKALLVDQPPHIQRYVEKAGYISFAAPNQSQAERLIKEEANISLMICNASASESDFISLATSVPSEGYMFTLVVANFYEQNQLLGQLARAGADDFLCNPVTRDMLESKLNIAKRVVSLENRLRSVKKKEAFSRQNALLMRMLPGVFHEMNNPIGFVGSNLSTMQSYVDSIVELVSRHDRILDKLVSHDSLLSPELRELIETYHGFAEKADIAFTLSDMNTLLDESKAGVKSIQKLANDLQKIALADDKSGDGAITADINDCLRSALTIAWNAIKYKATVQASYGDLPPVPFPPAKLSQVFLIILDNAVRSINTAGTIAIHTTDNRGSALVRINVLNNDKTEGLTNFSRTTGAMMDMVHSVLNPYGGILEMCEAPSGGEYIVSFSHTTTTHHDMY